MSVAFTKEDSAETASETLLPDRPISTHANLVTEAGLKALELQLEQAREACEAAQKIEDVNERRRQSAIPSRDVRYFAARVRTAQVMLIWLAGLTGIPQEARDAAAVDGAGTLARFWYIDLPLLRPTSLLVASLATINAFQSFVLQFVLSSDQGGPANSTLVLGLLVFKYGFQYFRMGDAAAVSVVMFALIMSVTLVQLWLGRRVY